MATRIDARELLEVLRLTPAQQKYHADRQARHW